MVQHTLESAVRSRAELSVSIDPRTLGLVSLFVREMSSLAGLEGEQVDEIVAAVDEACRDVIGAAFDADQSGTIEITGELAPAALTLKIREHGLPLEGSEVRRAPGWHLVDHTFDELRWVNHGVDGSELSMIKYRPTGHITDQLPAAELTAIHHEVPLAPEQEYTIRRLRPEDAIHVAQCIYRAYGYSYPNQDLYYPERILHLNETGELISCVTVDQAGEIVGHLALERTDLGPTAESGQAVVIPAHRHRHLLERMRQFAEVEGHGLGLRAVWSEPVTSHVYSQRMNEELGSHVAGVRFGVMPSSVRFKEIRDDPAAQRESCMFYVKFLAPSAPAVVHVPPHHRDMVKRIYEHLEAPVEMRTGGSLSGPSALTVSYDRQWGFGQIRVLRAGKDTAAEIRQAQKDLVEASGVQVIYLELPLTQAGASDLCLESEGDGFFFSGVCPLFAPDGDALRLQYLTGAFDPSRLQVEGPFAREIVDYAVAEMNRLRN